MPTSIANDPNIQSVGNRFLMGLQYRKYLTLAFAVSCLIGRFYTVDFLQGALSGIFVGLILSTFSQQRQINSFKLLLAQGDACALMHQINRTQKVRKIFQFIYSPLLGPLTVIVYHLVKYDNLIAGLKESPFMFYFMFGSVLLAVPLFYLFSWIAKKVDGV